MRKYRLKNLTLVLMVTAAAASGGCSNMGPQRDTTHEAINQELDSAVKNRVKPATPEAVSQALLPPLAEGQAITVRQADASQQAQRE